MILRFWIDKSVQTVQTQIRWLLKESTLFAVQSAATHFCMVKQHFQKVTIITAIFRGLNYGNPSAASREVFYSNSYINEPPHDKTNKMTVCPAKSDQPGHPPSLISFRCSHEESLGP